MNEVFARAPHLRSPAVEQSPHAALMIDFDNVTMGIRSNLGQEIGKLLDSDIIRGKVSVQRAYADWRRYPQYIVPLSEASVDLIFAPAYGSSKKNATDIRLAIDALEIVFTRPEIGTFILLSGDSDFSSLVLKLKEYGKYVIGVGMQESSSDLLVQNCDEYYSYNSLSGLTAASEATTETFDPWVLAARTIERMVERKDVMRSDRFKQVMLEFDASFSERSLGFSKFNRFLSEAASRGIINLEKAANGQYEVSPGARAGEISSRSGGKSSSATPSRTPARSSSSSSRSRGGRGRRNGSRKSSRGGQAVREAPPADGPAPEVDEDRLRAAYTLLRDVVGDLASRGDAVRDSEVKRQMLKRNARFDEAALGFRKFSRFLRQAHDEEVINLEQGAEGNYLVSPIASESGPAHEVRREPEARPQPETRPEPEPAAEAAPAEPEEGRTRRGLGRFRRGSRGRTAAPKTRATSSPQPNQQPQPKPEPQPKAETPAESTDTSADFKSEIERMSRVYPGVGRRTAARLYEEFGAGLLGVIDGQPDRIKAILPEHRAKAVIDGRKAEREAGD